MIDTSQELLMAPIRILLVDDSTLFLATTARILGTDEHVAVAGQVTSGLAALEEVARGQYDLVLLDIGMPEMNGLEVGRRIKNLPDPPRIVLLTLTDDAEYREAAVGLADAFLHKSQTATHLLPVIHGLFKEPLPDGAACGQPPGQARRLA